MGFLDKAKQAAEQAKEAGQQFADRANDKVSDVQTQRELQKVYGEIGEAAFRLADSGAISHPDLDPLVARARELHQKLHEEGARDADAPVDSPHSDPPEAVEQPLSGAGPGAA
jgi:hypothetical protein